MNDFWRHVIGQVAAAAVLGAVAALSKENLSVLGGYAAAVPMACALITEAVNSTIAKW